MGHVIKKYNVDFIHTRFSSQSIVAVEAERINLICNFQFSLPLFGNQGLQRTPWPCHLCLHRMCHYIFRTLNWIINVAILHFVVKTFTKKMCFNCRIYYYFASVYQPTTSYLLFRAAAAPNFSPWEAIIYAYLDPSLADDGPVSLLRVLPWTRYRV